MEFVAALMAYCYRFRGSVTSWGRTVEHNEEVGGVETSFHMEWLAADVEYDDLPLRELRELVAKRLGLRLIVESDHDHLQPIKKE